MGNRSGKINITSGADIINSEFKVQFNETLHQLKDLQKEYDNTVAKVSKLKNANAELTRANRDLSESLDYIRYNDDRAEKIRELERTLSDITSRISEQFSSLLAIGGSEVEDYTDGMNGRFQYLFDSIRKGSISVQQAWKEAITVDDTLVKSLGSYNLFDSSSLAEFNNETRTATASQQNLASSTENLTVNMDGAYRPVMQVSKALEGFNTIDTEKMNACSSALRAIANLSGLEAPTEALRSLSKYLDDLGEYASSGKLDALTNVDIRGFSEIKVSKATLRNLAEYMPVFSNETDVSALQKLANIDWTKFNSLSFSKGKADNLQNLAASSTQLKDLVQQLHNALTQLGIDSSDAKTGLAGLMPDSTDDTVSYSQELRNIKQLYTELNSISSHINQTKSKIRNTPALGDQTTGFTDKLEIYTNKLKGWYDQIEKLDIASSDFSDEFTNLQADVRKGYDEITKLNGSIDELVQTENNANKSDAALGQGIKNRASAYASLEKQISSLSDKVGKYADILDPVRGDDSFDTLNGLKTNIGLLSQYKSRIEALDPASSDFKEKLSLIKGEMAEVSSEITSQTLKLDGLVATWNKDPSNVKNTKSQAQSLKEVEAFITKCTKAQRDWSAAQFDPKTSGAYNNLGAYITQVQNLANKYKQGQITQEQLKAGLTGLQSEFSATERTIRSNGRAVQSFGAQISQLFNMVKNYISPSAIISSAISSFRTALSTAVDIEDSLAQLKIVTNATDNDLVNFFDTATEHAKELGASITDVLSSIEVFSRLGYNLEDASTLSNYATALSKVAATTEDEATSGLTSIIKGFGMDVSEAEHVSDVLIKVGQEYAISASELMAAFERSGAAMNASNTSFEKSTALYAAANAAVQDASTVGTALKTVSARIRGAKSDLEDLGEDTDGLAQGFSKYAEELKGLTGFDILVEGTSDTYKDIYDIFEGISKAWDNLSDTQQSRVAEILGGTRQLQIITSILQNWGDAAGSYEAAMNAAGTTTKAVDVYTDTTTSELNTLKSTFAEFARDIVSSDLTKTVVDIGTGLISFADSIAKFTNKAGGLKTTLGVFLSAATLTKGVKVFSTLKGTIAGVASGFKNFVSIMKPGAASWENYNNLAKKASDAQTAYQNALTASKSKITLTNNANTTATSVEKLHEEATRSSTVAQEAYAAAAQKTAAKISIYTLILTAAVAAISYFTNKEKEREQAIRDASDAAVESSDSIFSAVAQYSTLDASMMSNEEYSESLQSIHEELSDALGDEANSVSNLVGSYDNLSNTLEERVLPKLQQNVLDAKEGLEQYEEDLDKTARKVSTSTTNKNIFSVSEGDSALNEIADRYKNFVKAVGSTKVIDIGDALTSGNISKIERAFELVQELRVHYSQIGDKSKYDWASDIYRGLQEAIGNYKDAIGDYNTNVAQSVVTTALLGKEVPKTKSEFEAWRDALIEETKAAQNGKDETVKFAGGVESVESAIDSVLQQESSFAKFYQEIAKEAKSAASATKSYVDVLSDVQSLQDGADILDEIYTDIADGGDFDWSSILNNDDFKTAFGGLGDAYDNFIKTVANGNTNLESCQNAFDNLLTAFIQNSGALDGLTEDTRDATVAMLEQMGVANAAEIVDAQLAQKEIELAQKKIELAMASEISNAATLSEIDALYNESLASQNTAAALFNVLNARIANGEFKLSTASDIEQFIALANAAGASADYIQQLAIAKNLFASSSNWAAKAAELGGTVEGERAEKFASQFLKRGQAQIRSISTVSAQKLSASNFIKATYGGGSNYRSSGGSSGSGSSSSNSEETWFEKQYKEYQHAVEMGQKTQADFLNWLNWAYQKAYKEGILELDDYYGYMEDVYNGIKDLYEEAEDAYEELVDYRIEMLESEIEAQKDALDKQLDDLKDFYDKQKDLLKEQKDEEDYIKEQSEKRKTVSDIEYQLAQLEFDNSAAAAKKRAELTDELAEANDELAEFERDNAYDVAEKMLDDEYEAQEKLINDAINVLDEKLNDPHSLRNQALTDIKNNTTALYQAMLEYNRTNGDGKDSTVSDMWEAAYTANEELKKATGGYYNGTKIVNATGSKYNTSSSSAAAGTSQATKTSSSSSSSAPSLKSGSYVEVKSGTKWYANSYGGGASGTAHSGKILYINESGTHPYNIDGLGWVKKSDIVGYKSGTKNAKSGLHGIYEDGDELIFSSVSGEKYKIFNGGEKVFDAAATNFLYDFANGGGKLLSNMVSSAINKTLAFAHSGEPIYNISSGDIIINGNADQKTVSEIRRAQRENVDYLLKTFKQLQK